MRIPINQLETMKIPPQTRAVKFYVETPNKYSQKLFHHYVKMMYVLFGDNDNLRMNFAPAISVKFERPHELLEVEFLDSKMSEFRKYLKWGRNG